MALGDLQTLIPPEEHDRLYMFFGPHCDTIIRKCFTIWLRNENIKLRTMTYIDRLKHIHGEITSVQADIPREQH